MIRIRCPGCERTLTIKDASAGAVKECPACGKKFRVPRAASNSDSVPPATDRKSSRPSSPPDEEEVYEDLEVVAPNPRQADEEEGIQEKPRPSQAGRKSRSVDYEEVDESDDRPRRRKTRKRRKRLLVDKEEGIDVFSWVSPFMFCMAGLVLSWFVLTALALLIPRGTSVLFGTGLCVTISGRIWLLVMASHEDELRNCLIIPFYEIIFIFNYISETWKPCVLYAIGILMLLTAGLLWVIHDVQDEFHHNPAPIHHHHPMEDLDN